MELDDAKALAIELMTEHKIYPKWVFRFDNSKRRFGQARSVKVRGRYLNEITMSRHLTLAGSDFSVKDTILHEIAHVLVGLEHMHDAKWRKKAIAIGCSADLRDIDVQTVIDISPYKYHCDACKALVFYSHKPKGVGNMYCEKCRGEEITRTHHIGEVTLGVV